MLNLNNGKEYFGENFIMQFEEFLQSCKENNIFLFMHGTPTKADAEDICHYGLVTEFPELYYTCELISNKDILLYDKLKSWPHWNYKFLVMCCVPKNSGKGGLPIWKKEQDELVRLPPEFIRGYIDVLQRRIIQNELYSQIHNHQNLIEDTSYLPISGQKLKISIPSEEIPFYNEFYNEEK